MSYYNSDKQNDEEVRQNAYHMSNNRNLRQRQLQTKQQDDRKKFTKEYFYQFLQKNYKGCVNFEKEYEKIKNYLRKRNRSLFTLEQTLNYWIGRDKQSLYYKNKIKKIPEKIIQSKEEVIEIDYFISKLATVMRC